MVLDIVVSSGGREIDAAVTRDSLPSLLNLWSWKAALCGVSNT